MAPALHAVAYQLTDSRACLCQDDRNAFHIGAPDVLAENSRWQDAAQGGICGQDTLSKTTSTEKIHARFLTLVQFISIRRAWLRAVRYSTGFHYGRNEALLPRLRHERDRGPGAAGCPRRP